MSVLDPVTAILSEYHKRHDLTQVEIRVDFLRPIFEEMGYVDKIIWERFLFESKYIAAQIKTYRADMGTYKGIGEYARIQFSSGLNYCWRRFVVCKEMYHCILDREPQTRISNTADLLKLSEYLTADLLEELAGEAETFVPFDSEKLAEILAIETLFPMELRRMLCDPLDDGKITHRQVALRYRIPEEYVHIGMSAGYYTAALRGRENGLIKL